MAIPFPHHRGHHDPKHPKNLRNRRDISAIYGGKKPAINPIAGHQVDTGLTARLFRCSFALVHPTFQRVIRHVQPPCVNGIALTVTLFSLTCD